MPYYRSFLRRGSCALTLFAAAAVTPITLAAESATPQTAGRVLPAHVAAGWIDYARVDSNNQYWRDVGAGATIGNASTLDFGSVDTQAGNLSFGPTISFRRSTHSGDRYVSPAEARSSNYEELSPYFGLRMKLEF